MSLFGRWSTSGSEVGNAHFLHKNTIEEAGQNRRTNEQTLGVNSRAKRGVMQHYINRNANILTRSYSLDPFFSATVSGVDRICPSPSPAACQLLSPTNYLLASRYHSRTRRDFKSKNPLSGFAPKQTKESSAWRTTYIMLHTDAMNNRRRKTSLTNIFTFHFIARVRKGLCGVLQWEGA